MSRDNNELIVDQFDTKTTDDIILRDAIATFSQKKEKLRIFFIFARMLMRVRVINVGFFKDNFCVLKT